MLRLFLVGLGYGTPCGGVRGRTIPLGRARFHFHAETLLASAELSPSVASLGPQTPSGTVRSAPPPKAFAAGPPENFFLGG